MVSYLLKKINYLKPTQETPQEYEMLVLEETDTSIFGLSLKELTEKEIEEVKQIQIEYTEKIKPFVKKAYRKFLKERIISE